MMRSCVQIFNVYTPNKQTKKHSRLCLFSLFANKGGQHIFWPDNCLPCTVVQGSLRRELSKTLVQLKLIDLLIKNAEH
ncbi:hypothetical protein T10_5985 [Trichinella papuae]|uniref:Uncharacterized protein n=1 Tax=Trichinella papuae TaxID=268474 RepID=A0A0V1M9S2_9BILA|nr:hypothetical protein T10_5985 [Trichinella papuae]